MRRLLLPLVAVMVMGCSGAGGSTASPSAGGSTASPTAGGSTEQPTAGRTASPTAPPEPSSTVEAPVSVTGDPVTGASATFTLAYGNYDVAWTTTADTAGCYFSLVVATSPDGPIFVKLLPEAKSYSGTFLWTFVPAGTYVLQEDRSGVLACKGPWSATITPWAPATPS